MTPTEPERLEREQDPQPEPDAATTGIERPAASPDRPPEADADARGAWRGGVHHISREVIRAAAEDLRLVRDEGRDAAGAETKRGEPRVSRSVASSAGPDEALRWSAPEGMRENPEAGVARETPAPAQPSETGRPPAGDSARLLDSGGHREAVFLGLPVVDPGGEPAKEEEYVNREGIISKCRRLGVGTAAVMFVVFVVCDIYIKTDATEWFKTLLKILPLGIGLGFAILGLWSERVVTKCISAVLIGLFLMHAVNRRPIQRLLREGWGNPVEVRYVGPETRPATTNN